MDSLKADIQNYGQYLLVERTFDTFFDVISFTLFAIIIVWMVLFPVDSIYKKCRHNKFQKYYKSMSFALDQHKVAANKRKAKLTKLQP